MTSTFVISPSTPTGNNRRIELVGMDQWTIARIDNVFVYPSEINLDRLKKALNRTLSVWAFVTGRVLLENEQHCIIEICDNPIPVAFVVNNDLKEWPLNSDVIVEVTNSLFPMFIDGVQVMNLCKSSTDEPL
ncbi:unnamed protein product, partial [Rotaria socialis]